MPTHSASTADLLLCIASYHPSQQRRLSCAFTSVSPSTRLIAEMVEAQETVYFTFAREDDGAGAFACATTPSMLATSTTSLAKVRQCLGSDEDTRGVRRVWERISRYTRHAQLSDLNHAASSARPERKSDEGDKAAVGSTKKENTGEDKSDKRRTLCGQRIGGIISVLVSAKHLSTRSSSLPFSSTLASSDTISPHIMHGVPLQKQQRGAIHGSIPQDLFFLFSPTTAHPDHLSLPEAATFRAPTGTLGGAFPEDGDWHKAISASATHAAAKLAAFASSRPTEQENVLYRNLYVLDSSGITDVMLGVSQWWLQRPLHPRELPYALHASAETMRDTSVGMIVPMHLKMAADVFAVPWASRFSQSCNSVLAQLPIKALHAVMCLVLWVLRLIFTLLGFPWAVTKFAAEAPVAVNGWMRQLGMKYGAQIEAFDASHTTVTGAHLLSFAIASSTLLADEPELKNGRLRALDIAGCPRVHLNSPLPRELSGNSLFDVCDEVLATGAPPHAISAAGQAFARLTYSSSLQLINTAGSSAGDAVITTFGHSCLLYDEARCVMRSTTENDKLYCSCSLLAINVTGCEALCDLNALAFTPSLLQILASFTSVDSLGIAHLDGRNRSETLRSIAAAAHTRTTSTGHTQETFKEQLLEKLLAHDSVASAPHFYHLDFTFCIHLEDIRFLKTQSNLQYLNISQTRVTDVGIALALTAAECKVPLRVLIAEFCDHVGNLAGIAGLTMLKKLYIRSGSLAEDGLRRFAEVNKSVVLLDLSYCEKIHDVGCLSALQTLEVLILDSSEIPRSGVVALANCPRLSTLSLRFCPDFADIGTDKEKLAQRVVSIPTLRHFYYADFADMK